MSGIGVGLKVSGALNAICGGFRLEEGLEVRLADAIFSEEGENAHGRVQIYRVVLDRGDLRTLRRKRRMIAWRA